MLAPVGPDAVDKVPGAEHEEGHVEAEERDHQHVQVEDLSVVRGEEAAGGRGDAGKVDVVDAGVGNQLERVREPS